MRLRSVLTDPLGRPPLSKKTDASLRFTHRPPTHSRVSLFRRTRRSAATAVGRTAQAAWLGSCRPPVPGVTWALAGYQILARTMGLTPAGPRALGGGCRRTVEAGDHVPRTEGRQLFR